MRGLQGGVGNQFRGRLWIDTGLRQHYDCLVIPPFQPNGHLPDGIHSATWTEVRERFGWNQRRQNLLVGLEKALRDLHEAGCKRIYLNGSFVTSKNEPGDFDACWDPTDVNFDTLEPTLLEFDDARAAQKARYGGELFPTDWDAIGNGTTFLEFFQSIRGGGKKGIVRIELTTPI
jgi:hypothetical protein